MATSSSERVKFVHLLAFIGPCLPFAALGLPLVVTLPEYYSHHMQMGAIVGAVFFWVRSIDIFVDPLIGWSMDRTRTKFGRFKLWMLLCLPILFIATGFIFLPDKVTSPLYLGAWLLVLYIGFSMAALSQSSWGSVLSSDYNERSRIFAFWQVANIAGIIGISLIPVFLDRLGYTYPQAVKAMGITIMGLLPIMIAVAIFVVPEPASQIQMHEIRLSDYFVMLKRKNVRKILWADLFMGLAPGITGVFLFFFFEQVKGLSRGESTQVMALYFIAGVIGSPIWFFLSKRFGKHQTLAISAYIFAGLYFLLLFIPKHNFIISALCVFCVGIPYAASLLLTRSLMADIGDEVIYDTGHDHKGTLMAILSATTKLGYAFSALTLTFVGWLGFDPKLDQNSEDALFWLQAAFIGLPVVFLILGGLSLIGYDLDYKKLNHIQITLKERSKP